MAGKHGQIGYRPLCDVSWSQGNVWTDCETASLVYGGRVSPLNACALLNPELRQKYPVADLCRGRRVVARIMQIVV